MSTTTTFTGTLNNYGTMYGWENENLAGQGNWGYGTRTGVIYFAGLTALKDKVINSVQITVTTGATGYNASKTASFYESASQGGIDTSLNAGHKTGSVFATVTDTMYNNIKTFTVSAFISKINAGQDTFCIYSGTTNTHYLKWSKVVLTVNWDEPTSTFTASSTCTMGSSMSVVISNANTSYTHTVRMTCGTASTTFYAKTTTRTLNITPPLSFASQIPSATSIAATLYVDTYSGSTLIGTTSKTVTLSVPTSVKPTIGTLTLAANSSPSGFSSYVIQSQSKIKATLSGYAGVYGSTISSIKITGYGATSTSATLTTDTITTSGSISFTATVTDSRGRTATVTQTITAYEYSAPKFSNVYAYRSDSSGNKDLGGTYLTAYANASVSAVGSNALTMTLKYKLTTASSWTSVTLTNATKKIISGFLLDYAYNVQIILSDTIGSTATFTESIGTKIVLTSERVDSDGIPHITFGGLSMEDGAVFEMPALFNQGLQSKLLADGVDLDDITTQGLYRRYSGRSVLNSPMSTGSFTLIVFDPLYGYSSGEKYCRQFALGLSTFTIQQRYCANGTWSAWTTL